MGAIPKAQKTQCFKNMLKNYFEEISEKKVDYSKGACRAPKPLRKFEFSVPGQMGAILFRSSDSAVLKRNVLRI